MCGIVGYVGNNDAYPILIGGLQRLEYRGYDSAGIATLVENGAMHIRRAKGKLENLRAMVGQAPLGGHIGIGHTRWATHGKPSEENAHPHKAGPVAVIHNGIVENFVALRAELVARGHKMKSETDTELISHLIEENLGVPSECGSMGASSMGLTEAVRTAVGEAARLVFDRRDFRDRARQAGGGEDRDPDGARIWRGRELYRVGYSRAARAYAQRRWCWRMANSRRLRPRASR